jgi:hypothetical protein
VCKAGITWWVGSISGNIGYGIDRRTARFTMQVTANVLQALTGGPAAAKHRP